MCVLSRVGRLALLSIVVLTATGCRYGVNRYYDFRDTFAIGIGLTNENPVTGILPPSLGLYVEVTDFLHLGAITHNGYTAELDLRGTFVGPEYRTRAGFLGWQLLQINQDYENGSYNAFKSPDFPWSQRMADWGSISKGHPAKRLNYDYWAHQRQTGQLLLHRGWQYWEYIGAEVAVSDPFLTHFGLMLRAGVDISEISDFLLGIFGYDFKRDDMTLEEFNLRKRPDIYEEWPADESLDLEPAEEEVEESDESAGEEVEESDVSAGS